MTLKLRRASVTIRASSSVPKASASSAESALSKMIGEATYELREFSLEDVHFRRLGSDVVALAYKVPRRPDRGGREREAGGL